MTGPGGTAASDLVTADAEIAAAVHAGSTRATVEGANRAAAPNTDNGGGGGRGSGGEVERHEGDSRTQRAMRRRGRSDRRRSSRVEPERLLI